LQNKLFALSHR